MDLRLLVLSDALLLDQLEALVHLTLEAKVQHAVGFIEYQVTEMAQVDARGVLQMIEEAARSANDHSHSLPKSGFLLARVLTTHYRAGDHVVEELKQLF